jgi:hypothetical protein
MFKIVKFIASTNYSSSISSNEFLIDRVQSPSPSLYLTSKLQFTFYSPLLFSWVRVCMDKVNMTDLYTSKEAGNSKRFYLSWININYFRNATIQGL